RRVAGSVCRNVEVISGQLPRSDSGPIPDIASTTNHKVSDRCYTASYREIFASHYKSNGGFQWIICLIAY
ncbi:hypothetical protein, partial [Endozoicomonas sp. ONNA2]|uniref:hypothetical protein n=1 Tax=Endozoicomonas sp. ONNA2 TaxID=2828741 RepID=UPI002148AFC0